MTKTNFPQGARTYGKTNRSTSGEAGAGEKQFVQVHCATVRFAGDSGDGMQLAGSQFADIASMTGTVVCTLPDYPSEDSRPGGFVGRGERLSTQFRRSRGSHARRFALRADRHESGGA